MKKAFTKWYNYLLALGILIVISCIAIIPYFVFLDDSKWPIKFISYVYLFAGVVVFGIGFIIQDIYRAKIRHKTKNWNNPLPDEKVNTAWAIFCPMFTAGLLSLLVGGILSVFLK